jgi:drug/metabolite transporter (DMT)-like permease
MSSVFLLIPLLLLSAGQLSAALSGRAIASGGSLFNPFTAAAYLFLALRGLSWVLIVRRFPLSRAYPMMSLGYVVVPLAAALFLGDRLEWRTLVGMVLISTGVAVVSSGNLEAQNR